MVPLLDLTRQYQELKPQLDKAVIDLLASGQYVLGPAVDAFEAEAAQALGVRHAIGVSNGTDALQIALQAMGVGPGDEVITTPFSFIATAEVVARLGARPIFCDIEADTFNIDPQQIEAHITSRTKAIVPVHLFGHPAPMAEINAIAARYGLPVLEDAAQGWGASLQNETGAMIECGALGTAGSFSFFPSKNLGACGEGGLLSTDDDKLAAGIKKLRVHGQSRRYIHDEIGYNARLHALQAAILSVKLPHATRWNDARRTNADRYRAALGDLPLILPTERSGARHVYHQYVVRVPEGGDLQRDRICEALTRHHIGWAIYYPVPLHLQPVFQDLGYQEGSLPITEQMSREVFALPIFPELREDEVEQVCQVVREGCQ